MRPLVSKVDTGVLAWIRQNTCGRVLLLEICGVTYCFAAGAFGWRLEYLRGFSDLPRLVVPLVAAVAVFLARNGIRNSRERNYATAFVDMILAAAAVILSQTILELIHPAWVLRWAPTQGGFVGWAFLTAVRTIFPGGPPETGPGADSVVRPEELQWKVGEMRRQVRLRNVIALGICAALVVVFWWIGGHSTARNVRVGAGGLIVFGVMTIAGVFARGGLLQRTGQDEMDIASYEDNLRRQYRAMMGVWWGMIGLALPSCVALLYGTHVYEFVVVVYLLLFAEVVLRSAEGYRREISRPDGIPLHSNLRLDTGSPR